MNLQDTAYILRWFLAFFAIGIAFLPLTFSIFNGFKDKGYIFSKIIGMGFLTYFVFLIGTLRIAKFSTTTVYLSLLLLFLVNYAIFIYKKQHLLTFIRDKIKIFVAEELVFLITLIFWSFIRSNVPDIHGLEKFMDFGFLNSILRSDYFPAKDMWYTPLSINYYYFGHLITAVLTKLTSIPSFISYNLMLAVLFAFTFTGSLSIGMNFFDKARFSIKSILAGLISGILVSLGGNLTTIYAFFAPYTPADKAVPFWQLPFLPFSFPNSYWYPNATRFIPFTIHEFPIYSFVVSDLHGHVLDIPFVLLVIALLFLVMSKAETTNSKRAQKSTPHNSNWFRILDFMNRNLFENWKFEIGTLLLISFLLAVMYMTNAWDGLIYLLLTFLVLAGFNFYKWGKNWILYGKYLSEILIKYLILFFGFFIFSLPFNLSFKPFVSGVGVICAPKFLTNIGKIGPFLFEANHCQRSPLWQLLILYGFFYFFVILFLVFLKFKKKYKFTVSDIFVLVLIVLSTVLIVMPEFIYVKDIYPTYYRANTMFKLVYESFIMLSLSSGYILIKLISSIKRKKLLIPFSVITATLLFLVLVYPVFAINSYYKNLKTYQGLNGIDYLFSLYPGDYNLINWLNRNIGGQPVILEANGDSYTDYARISANTGLPTVIGWPVHEWLWRGTYDIVAPRISDVLTLYTTNDFSLAENLIRKYNISYVVVSDLERQKYPNLNELTFMKLGKLIYQSGNTKLYKINP